MRTFGNIIWHFPYLGFLNAINMYILGFLFVLTGVGFPIRQGMFQIGKFYFAPFSYALVDTKELAIQQDQTRDIRYYLFIVARILYFPIGLIFAIIYVYPNCITFYYRGWNTCRVSFV